MFYLFWQILFWIVLAFVTGLLIGWFFWGRSSRELQDQLDSCNQKLYRCMEEKETNNHSVESYQEAPEESSEETQSESTETKTESTEPQMTLFGDRARPARLSAPPEGQADDLTKIKGIGPKLSTLLNELDIHQFSQIAEFSRENIEWVDDYLSFKGRIDREKWVEQAKTLADRGETD